MTTRIGAIAYSDDELAIVQEAKDKVIDLLHTLSPKLKYLVVKTLYESFPMERIFEKPAPIGQAGENGGVRE